MKEPLILEPRDQKKWIPHSICNENHCVPAEIFFQNFKKKLMFDFGHFGVVSKSAHFAILMKKSIL